MKDKKEQIPEYLLRLLVLRKLDSQYPGQMQYQALEDWMKTKVSCSPHKLARVVTYLEEPGYIRGIAAGAFGRDAPSWITAKITAKGIDHLESLEEKRRLEVEKKEKELGIGFQP